MYKHLKEQQYYEDLYDTHTIEICLEKIDMFKDIFSKESADKFLEQNKDMTIKDFEHDTNLYINRYMFFLTGDRYKKRRDIITEWLKRDGDKDNKLESTQSKEITCYYCKSIMDCDDRLLHRKNVKDKDEIVLFFYNCPSCKKRRAFFEDGEEFLPKSELCPKCNNLITTQDKSNDNKFITIYKCSKCDYSKTDEVERYKPKKLFKDEDFPKLKEQFCLSEKEGQKFISWLFDMERLDKELKKDEEKKKQQAVYDKIKELNKPKIFDLQELLSKDLEKCKFVKLNFKEPQIDKFVTIEFTIYDSESSRSEYDAKNLLQKQIELILKETNWILMSNGISYRLGMLSGRLKAYEREENLVELVNKRFKDLKPKEEKLDTNKKDSVVKGVNGEDVTL